MTDQQIPDPSELPDPRPAFAVAVDTAATVIAAVRADQMNLPTPCGDFDVRTLLGHLLGVLQRTAVIGDGGDPFSVEELIDGIADDAWMTEWNATAAEAERAWLDPAKLAMTVTMPWAVMPGAALLATYINELTVHTWDVAVATGQSPDWNHDVAELAYISMQIGLPAEGRMESFAEAAKNMPEGMQDFPPPFAEAITVPDDAPMIDKLVAWNGRTPV